MGQANIQTIQDTLTCYRNDYMEALPDSFDSIEKQVRLVSTIDRFKQASNALFRDVHSLKGTAGTYDLQIISIICHQIEDELTTYKATTVESCLKYIDFLYDALTRAKSSAEPNYDDILERMYRYQKMVSKNKFLGALVDPSRMNAQLIQGLIKPYPIKLTTMSDGLAALSRLLFVKYDFIIVSKELPSLDGAALLNALHSTNCSNRNTNTLLISSSDKIPAPPTLSNIIHKDTHFSENLIVKLQEILPSSIQCS